MFDREFLSDAIRYEFLFALDSLAFTGGTSRDNLKSVSAILAGSKSCWHL